MLELPEEQGRYLVKVHRKRVGDRIVLFDPLVGIQADATIVEDRLPRVQIRVEDPRPAPARNMPVTLIQALGKSDKAEQATRDATALGAERIQFVHSSRTVAKGKGEKTERLLRVAVQVARQCGRGDLPALEGPKPLDQVLAEWRVKEQAAKFVCGFRVGAPALLAAVEGTWKPGVPIAVLIGPEGGLSDDEVEAAEAVGFVVVGLGPYVLRMETAGAAALAALRAWLEARTAP